MASVVKDYYNNVMAITQMLVKEGFATSYNWPSHTHNSVSWSGEKNLTHVLKGEPYKNVYYKCLEELDYNFKLLDHALIQINYTFDKSGILSHRLAYLPHPEFENFQENPDDFEELHYGNNLFSEMLDRVIITSPIRFEYDSDEDKFKEFDHPRTHMTMGNYKHCRIALNKPLTPYKFILFILRSFYLERFNNHFTISDFDCKFITKESISINEKKMMHFSH